MRARASRGAGPSGGEAGDGDGDGDWREEWGGGTARATRARHLGPAPASTTCGERGEMARVGRSGRGPGEHSASGCAARGGGRSSRLHRRRGVVVCGVLSGAMLQPARVNLYRRTWIGPFLFAVPCISAMGWPLTRCDDEASRGNKLECWDKHRKGPNWGPSAVVANQMSRMT